MKRKLYIPVIVAGITAIFNLQTSSGQNSTASFWNKTDRKSVSNTNRSWLPNKYETFSLDVSSMKYFLASAPIESTVSTRQSAYIIDLPMPDGNFNRFNLVESSVVEKELADAYPYIKTYSGQGIDDPTATIRFDMTQFGFHGYILSSSGTIYIDPVTLQNTEKYLVFYKHDLPVAQHKFECLVELPDEKRELNNDHFKIYQPSSAMSIGSQLRTYRLALAADYEYTAYYGGTRAGALAGMVTTMNRVNGVYERELGIHMNIIGNDTLLIYTTTSDPYTDSDGNAMLGQNTTTCNSVIGSANYDIGHVFSTGGGGIAGFGCVCGSNKAEGVTGSPDPIGDAFNIDYVVHEMGHQFGADHTFNSTTSSCQGNRVSSSAYEPGGASTIMGYAGICDPNDLQQNSDAYFHTKSFDDIVAFSQTGSGNTCAIISATGNHAPVISFPTTAHTIPYLTPFKLTATGSDPDGDPLTYCWEEYDLGPSCNMNSPVGNAPSFRSFNPTSSPTRLFPALYNILHNIDGTGEIKPGYNRSLKFQCTARDNRAGGGGVTHSPTTTLLNVDSTGIPFAITYPNTSIIRIVGAVDSVKWNVGFTDVAPINTPFVNIYLSFDNGQTFPTILGTSVPNSGSYVYIVPNNVTNAARIMVEGEGNVFFDINNRAFTITDPTGIHENPVSNNVGLYPNPSNDAVHVVINTPSSGKCNILLNDISGRLVKKISIEKNHSSIDQVLDVSDISAGMYIVRFELPEGTAEKKFVKN